MTHNDDKGTSTDMATEVTLPALGESVTEGTVTQWLKSVGDEIAVDEPLLEVSTDKVDTEIPSPVAGTLLEVKVQEDETVEVGAVLALVGDAGESAGGQDGQAQQAEPQVDESAAQQESAADGGGQAQQPTETAATGDAGTDEGSQHQAPSETAPAAQADASSSGDATEVKLPALGESVTEGTVTQWLKSVGDEIAVDESLLEVSTDKVDTEIPSPVAGTLLEIKVQEDETVEVGAVLALVGSGQPSGGGEQPSRPQAPQEESSSEAAPAEQEPPAAATTSEETGEQPAPESTAPQSQPTEQQASPPPAPEPSAPQQAPADDRQAPAPSHAAAGGDGEAPSYVTPLVRKLAAQHDVDLSTLTGTGVGGRIRKQDVLAAAESAKQAAEAPPAQPEETAAPTTQPTAASAAAATPSPLRGKTEKLSRLRKVIAARMVESLQVSAQLTTVVEVDVTAISRLRDRVKANFEQREGVKLSFLPFFAKAAIDALKTYPQVNASIDTEAGTVTYHDGEHLGVAVDTERGLLVPVIKDAGDLSIAGLARKIADLATRTRNNKISPDELSGGTFTLTNTGSRGALFDTPIINQPQVGILGTGTVVKRPVVISDPNLGETIAVRQMVYLALTYDHRLVDGADAARFLTSIKQRLEEASFESELGV